MKRTAQGLWVALTLLVAVSLPACTAADTPDARAIDQLLSGKFKAGEPGAAVLVTRKNAVILRKGYGMADLEMKIPIRSRPRDGTCSWVF